MTFSNFLQVLAFNLLSTTIPQCLLMFGVIYLAIRVFEKRISNLFKELSDYKGD